MSRLVINEELSFGRVEYASPNGDWAKVRDLQNGDQTFIHVYEKAGLHAIAHHSQIPVCEVPDKHLREPGMSVPSEGSIIRFKAGEEPVSGRARALAWVTADEWLKTLGVIQQTRWRHGYLRQGLNEQATKVASMFEDPSEPYRLYG